MALGAHVSLGSKPTTEVDSSVDYRPAFVFGSNLVCPFGALAFCNGVPLCRKKCLLQRIWENSATESSQLEGIGPAFSATLQKAGLSSLEQIASADPRRIELVCGFAAVGYSPATVTWPTPAIRRPCR